MNTLYIVGNGFDVAHKLKTSYWFFRKYLKKYAEDFYVKLEENYGYSQIDVDDYYIGKNPQKAINAQDKFVYDSFWKTIEEELGNVNEASMLSFSESIVSNLYLESGLIGIQDTLDYYWQEQYSFIKELQEYVYKWAKQIRLNKCSPMCEELIDNKEDLFLTFNYTNTLEKIYNIPSSNILHIHGGLPPYCSNKPILGHGNYNAIERCKAKIEKAERIFDEATVSIYTAIAQFYRDTLKNTTEILFNNRGFFQNFSNIDKVRIIGHSLGTVDFPYFHKTLQSVKDDTEWYIYYYAEEEREEFEKKMLELGIERNKLHVCNSSEFWN
ncbi:MAG: bacteriophage abortive infection AbiH family protein [Oscillospiraceae bacterium]|nr:bacteriophage abortive infection AbiH family protein [Oscillospiraceae bacterium]